MELVCVAHVFAGWVWGKHGPSTADSQHPDTAAKSAGWCSQTEQQQWDHDQLISAMPMQPAVPTAASSQVDCCSQVLPGAAMCQGDLLQMGDEDQSSNEMYIRCPCRTSCPPEHSP